METTYFHLLFAIDHLPLLFFVEADAHAAERAAVFVGEFEAGLRGAGGAGGVLAESDFEAEGEFQFVAGFAQALDGLGHFAGALDGPVDGRAQLLHDLFSFVVDFHNNLMLSDRGAGGQ